MDEVRIWYVNEEYFSGQILMTSSLKNQPILWSTINAFKLDFFSVIDTLYSVNVFPWLILVLYFDSCSFDLLSLEEKVSYHTLLVLIFANSFEFHQIRICLSLEGDLEALIFGYALKRILFSIDRSLQAVLAIIVNTSTFDKSIIKITSIYIEPDALFLSFIDNLSIPFGKLFA